MRGNKTNKDGGPRTVLDLVDQFDYGRNGPSLSDVVEDENEFFQSTPEVVDEPEFVKNTEVNNDSVNLPNINESYDTVGAPVVSSGPLPEHLVNAFTRNYKDDLKQMDKAAKRLRNK